MTLNLEELSRPGGGRVERSRWTSSATTSRWKGPVERSEVEEGVARDDRRFGRCRQALKTVNLTSRRLWEERTALFWWWSTTRIKIMLIRNCVLG